MKKKIILVGFYNEKALGVRCLGAALQRGGYQPVLVFFKEFHSRMPERATERELELLCGLVDREETLLIGMSVMSSLYLESIWEVSRTLRRRFSIPVVWGGTYATLEPERCLRDCDAVLRGEGEETLLELADKLAAGESWEAVRNVAWRDVQGNYRENPLRPLRREIDLYGPPMLGEGSFYFIHQNRVDEGDPQLRSFTYELAASRGCPFACSYCSSISLHRLYRGDGPYVRFRGVEEVIGELKRAKALMPNLKNILFWDEIFSSEPGWVEKFEEQYRREIGLPFRIWGHPLKVNERVMAHLVSAGLYQVVVGIQSGSPSVRRQIFHRYESQEEIVRCSKILASCRVPKVFYDLMLCHPFESVEQLKETFYLCLELEPPFSLSIHGLNFLPATDIVELAQEQGVYTAEELDKMMYCSIQEQYERYWGPQAHQSLSEEQAVWVALVYLIQFPTLRSRVLQLAGEAERGEGGERILRLKGRMERVYRLQELGRKARLLLRGTGR